MKRFAGCEIFVVCNFAIKSIIKHAYHWAEQCHTCIYIYLYDNSTQMRITQFSFQHYANVSRRTVRVAFLNGNAQLPANALSITTYGSVLEKVAFFLFTFAETFLYSYGKRICIGFSKVLRLRVGKCLPKRCGSFYYWFHSNVTDNINSLLDDVTWITFSLDQHYRLSCGANFFFLLLCGRSFVAHRRFRCNPHLK